MKFFLLFVALSFWYLSLCGAEAVASSDPNVDYILKGRSERIATYMKCSLSNEYCMCVEQVVRKGGEVFRCRARKYEGFRGSDPNGGVRVVGLCEIMV